MERIEDKKSKSLNVNNVPLNAADQKSWLEFKKIDEGKVYMYQTCISLSFCLHEYTHISTLPHTCIHVLNVYGTYIFQCFWQPVLGTINSEIAYKAQRPIIVDHPFVPVIGDFAIGAFNDLCETV